MENISGLMAFDMGELRNNLPKKRGLSRFYSGKARSYVCIFDVKCLEDLKKPTQLLDIDDDDVAYTKRKKKNKQSSSSSFSAAVNSNVNYQNYPCRRVSSSTHCSSPCMPKQKAQKKQLKSYKLRHINRTIQEGDAVLMRSSEPGKPSYVARVEAIEATDARGSNARVRVRWYYRPEESMGGRRQFHGAKEVFLSDHFDLQSADTIEGKCKVHSFSSYTKLSSVGNDDFFCRFEYNSATGAFIPDRVAVFCKCEMPYNPDDLMVQCEECSEWFHPSCIGTTIEAAKKLDHFYCEECSPEQQDLDNSNSTSKNTDAKVNTKRSLEVSKTRNKHAKRSG
ncbi:unnamed protein product [Brassica rapa]|uniref:BAH domain-containing protein n=1 Tax=Brassica campestris TaxID=3711 RepID=A0A3P6BW50_BRACM|nr:unnamed protein product [Brassica rapa]VDD06010.1 unnamed protein product [Brassica rapa]